MNYIKTILLCCITAATLVSCGDKELSKAEAKIQLEKYLNQGKGMLALKLKKGIKLVDNYDNLNLMNKFLTKCYDYVRLEGDWSETLSTNDYLRDFTILEKGKPYVVRGYDTSCTFLAFAKHEVEIKSITTAGTNRLGEIVCKVYFKDNLVLNDFGKALELEDGHAIDMTSDFLKMQDGWEIIESGSLR